MTMKPNDPESEAVLAGWLHPRLRNLPAPAAPPTLLPAVLARIAAQRARPWWRRPWFDWPPAARLFSALLALGLLGAADHFAPPFAGGGVKLPRGLAGGAGSLHLLQVLLNAGADSAAALVAHIRAPYLLAALCVVALVYFCTVGLATIFYQAAAPRPVSGFDL